MRFSYQYSELCTTRENSFRRCIIAKYPPSGPFSNGNPPAYNAGFGNNVEQFLGYAADSNITSDGNGNLNIANTGHYEIGGFTIIWAPNNQDLFINVPNAGGGRKLNIQVGGVTVAHIDSSGNMVLKGSLTQNGNP